MNSYFIFPTRSDTLSVTFSEFGHGLEAALEDEHLEAEAGRPLAVPLDEEEAREPPPRSELERARLADSEQRRVDLHLHVTRAAIVRRGGNCRAGIVRSDTHFSKQIPRTSILWSVQLTGAASNPKQSCFQTQC